MIMSIFEMAIRIGPIRVGSYVNVIYQSLYRYVALFSSFLYREASNVAI